MTFETSLPINLPKDSVSIDFSENNSLVKAKKLFSKCAKFCAKVIEKIVNHILGLFLDLLSLPIFVLALPTAVFDNNPKSLPEGTKKVTLCVHGFLHNKSAWIGMKPYLDNAPGVAPVFTLNLGHPFQSIEDYTRYVQEKINEIKKMAGNENLEIDLVGHSMGGLVCANYAVKYAEQDNVKVNKLVTVASPLQGTPMAYIFSLFCQCAAEMLPGSDFVRNLNEQMKNKNFACYHIGFGGDWIVSKSRTYFEGTKNHKEVSYLGHVSGLLAPQVRNFVVESLQEA